MAAFLHYTAHSDFADGIFVPYGTQVEAERQAAYDLYNGIDPEFIEGIFEAPYAVPKFGWTEADKVNGHHDLPHLHSRNRAPLLTRKEILSGASKHQNDIVNEGLKAAADYILMTQQAIKDGSAFKAAVPGNAYVVMTGGTATAAPAAMAAATAKTLVMITAAAANQPAVTEIGVSFDGITASAIPVLVELVSGTAASTGTVVAQTPKQMRGWPAQGSQTTGQITISAEPTVQLVNRKWYVTPNGGMLIIQFPLGREPTGIVTAATDAKTWSVRATAPAIVNAHAHIEFEE